STQNLSARTRTRPPSDCRAWIGGGRRRSADHPPVQFFGEGMDLAGDVVVGLQLQFPGLEVVVGFGLLERRLAVLADRHEGGQENRLQRDDEGYCGPRAFSSTNIH